MRTLAASALLLVAIGLGGCKRAHDVVGRFASNGGVGDTTLHFGQIDTSLLTNGSGWVRQKPGVAPDAGPPQQLQAPQSPDSAFTPMDSSPSAPSDSSAPRGRGRPVPDTLNGSGANSPRQRRDSVPPRPRAARPDTTAPDTSG